MLHPLYCLLAFLSSPCPKVIMSGQVALKHIGRSSLIGWCRVFDYINGTHFHEQKQCRISSLLHQHSRIWAFSPISVIPSAIKEGAAKMGGSSDVRTEESGYTAVMK